MVKYWQSTYDQRLYVVFLLTTVWLFSFCKSPTVGHNPEVANSGVSNASGTNTMDFRVFNQVPAPEEIADYLVLAQRLREGGKSQDLVDFVAGVLKFSYEFDGKFIRENRLDGSSSSSNESSEQLSAEEVRMLLMTFSDHILKVASCLKIDAIMFLGFAQAIIDGKIPLPNTDEPTKGDDPYVWTDHKIYKTALSCIKPQITRKKRREMSSNKKIRAFNLDPPLSLIYSGFLLHFTAVDVIDAQNVENPVRFYEDIFGRYEIILPNGDLKFPRVNNQSAPLQYALAFVEFANKKRDGQSKSLLEFMKLTRNDNF